MKTESICLVGSDRIVPWMLSFLNKVDLLLIICQQPPNKHHFSSSTCLLPSDGHIMPHENKETKNISQSKNCFQAIDLPQDVSMTAPEWKFTASLRCYQDARTKKGPNETRCEGEDVSLGTAHNMTGIKKQCKTQQWLTDEVLGLAGRRQELKSKRHPDETGSKLSTQASNKGYERWLDETLQEFIHSEQCRSWSNRTGEGDARGLFSTVKEIGQTLSPGGSLIRAAYGKSEKKEGN